jgi:hypothetical protein
MAYDFAQVCGTGIAIGVCDSTKTFESGDDAKCISKETERKL